MVQNNLSRYTIISNIEEYLYAQLRCLDLSRVQAPQIFKWGHMLAVADLGNEEIYFVYSGHFLLAS